MSSGYSSTSKRMLKPRNFLMRKGEVPSLSGFCSIISHFPRDLLELQFLCCKRHPARVTAERHQGWEKALLKHPDSERYFCMNCAYTGTCLLGMVIPDRNGTHGRACPFLFWQENPVSWEGCDKQRPCGNTVLWV